jgi:serine/threonine-protein kinase
VLFVVGVAAAAWLAGRSAGTSEPVPTPTTTATTREPEPVPTPPPVTSEPEPPPTPTVSASAAGRIVVRGVEEGASITIGGLAVEDARSGHSVDPGHYVVRIEQAERRPFQVEVDVDPGEEEIVTAVLEARVARPLGRLSINTRPWSKVYIGTRLLGTTPIAEASVQSGTVRLRIVDRDGQVFTRTITVPPNDEVSTFYNLRE